MKVIIAGGRDFDNFKLLERKCNQILKIRLLSKGGITIVSGDAWGADYLGAKYARKYDLNVKHFPADWKTNGKAAGPLRNEEMAEYADALIAFWDGKSRGTADMIQRAKDHGLKLRIIKY